jgi:hypothetical protein
MVPVRLKGVEALHDLQPTQGYSRSRRLPTHGYSRLPHPPTPKNWSNRDQTRPNASNLEQKFFLGRWCLPTRLARIEVPWP